MSTLSSVELPSVESMPDESRVWIFQSNRNLEQDELEFLKANLELFLADWAAHGKALFATYEFKYDRFLIVYLDEDQAGATGCSIDKLMSLISFFEEKLKLSFRDRMRVIYKLDETLVEVHLNDLKQLYSQSKIDDNTIVFNNLVQNKAAFKRDWESSLSNSWHQRFI